MKCCNCHILFAVHMAGVRGMPGIGVCGKRYRDDTILAKVREQGRASSSPSATETPPSSAAGEHKS